MTKKSTENPSHEAKELIAELLKERIYTTFAIMAVLLTIDPSHSTAGGAIGLVAGTVVSLWAASVVASRMAQRMVYRNEINHLESLRHSLIVHSSMLYAMLPPIGLFLLSAIGVLPLGVATILAAIGSGLLLFGWTLNSVRATHSGARTVIPTLLVQALVVVGVIVLKLNSSH